VKIWKRLCGTWTQNKLLSRKWWLAAGTVVVAVACDLAGRALGSETLQYLGIVVPAYLVVEGALDWAWKRKQKRETGEEDV
jgi:hypothetical protein